MIGDGRCLSFFPLLSYFILYSFIFLVVLRRVVRCDRKHTKYLRVSSSCRVSPLLRVRRSAIGDV